MQAWLLNILRKFLTNLILSWLTKLVVYLKELADQKKQREIDEANLVEYTKVIEHGGTDEEISKRGQDLLNGFGSPR